MKKYLILLLFMFSCTKQNVRPYDNKREQVALNGNGTLRVILLKNNTSHPNAFMFGTDYRTAKIGSQRVFDVFNDGFYFTHYSILSGDSSVTSPYSFVEDTIVYGYPSISLQKLSRFNDPNMQKGFLAWFSYKTNAWLTGHECTTCSNIVTKPSTDSTFLEIDCKVN